MISVLWYQNILDSGIMIVTFLLHVLAADNVDIRDDLYSPLYSDGVGAFSHSSSTSEMKIILIFWVDNNNLTPDGCIGQLNVSLGCPYSLGTGS